MKSAFISEISGKIFRQRQQMEHSIKIFKRLKDLPGIKYLEEILNKELNLSTDFYSTAQIYVAEEIHPDIMCSVAGEIEAELDFECVINQDIYAKRLTYSFYATDTQEGSLYIIIGNPVCSWVIEEERTEYFKSTDVRRKTLKGRMLCD